VRPDSTPLFSEAAEVAFQRLLCRDWADLFAFFQPPLWANRVDQSPQNKCSGNEISPIESSIEEDSTKSPPRARRYCRSGTRPNRRGFLHSLIYKLAHRTARRYPSKSGWHMPPARSLDSVHPHPRQAAQSTLDRASICAAGSAEQFPKAIRVSQARSYRREGQCHRH
jgi:hypothetical protein